MTQPTQTDRHMSNSFSIEDTKALFLQDEENLQDMEAEEIEHLKKQKSDAHVFLDTPSENHTDQHVLSTHVDMVTPTTVIDTSKASIEPYVPMLPKPVSTEQKRQLILDTETTGLDAHNGDRIIEIGVVEVINRRFTGEKLHVYIDPERGMDPEAVAVHGITPEFLAGKPKFADVSKQVFDFLKDAEIIAHNAPFDIGFLNAEFERVGVKKFDQYVSVTDSLAVAKTKYPGQKNSLDALVKRLEIITKDRTFHGALLDAEILADVYLTMTGGQVKLVLGETAASLGEHKTFANATYVFTKKPSNSADITLHIKWLESMSDKSDNFSERWQNL